MRDTRSLEVTAASSRSTGRVTGLARVACVSTPFADRKRTGTENRGESSMNVSQLLARSISRNRTSLDGCRELGERSKQDRKRQPKAIGLPVRVPGRAMRHRRPQLLCTSLTTALLMGCALDRQITGASVDYNVVIENANNAFLIDNILRARDHTPLYFTDVSQIHGSLQAAASTSVTLPFGPGKAPGKLYTALVGSSIQSSPNFDVAPLD